MIHCISRLSCYLISCCCFLIIGCGGGSGETQQEAQRSFLVLKITDAPIDEASEVVVEFTGVALKPASGPAIAFNFNQPRQIDLLTLQGDSFEPILNGVEVEPGQYSWVRLDVNAQRNTLDSYISFNDGSTYSLFVPSGDQRGLQISGGFLVPTGQSSSFTIYFDLRKSIRKPRGQRNDFILKPSLKLRDDRNVSKIRGRVDASLLSDESCNSGVAVYLYQGLDRLADDEGSVTSPESSSLVNFKEGAYRFVVGFLPPGDYTLALTCQADLDDPDTDDNIVFIRSQNLTTLANQTYRVVFD